MRGLSKTTLSEERGAFTTIFVAIASSGLLFFLFALTADAGTVFFERRSIQNAADATSLAVASNCAIGSTNCVDSVALQNTAQSMANLNSPDSFSTISKLCGFTPLSTCTSSAELECKSVPANLPRYGRVVLSTKNPDDSTRVRTPFFDLLSGPGSSSSEVKACSQSAWGKASAASIPIPLAITICDYQTDGYKIIRDYKSQLSACPTTIKDVQGITITPQPTKVLDGWAIFAPTGQQLFCLVPKQITVGMSLDTLPPGQERCNDANISGSDSKNVLTNFISQNLGKKIFIPVVASTSGTGNGSAQQVSSSAVGFFTFIFLGYDFGGKVQNGCGNPKTPCTEFAGQATTDCGSTRACIWGKFTRGIVPGVPVSRDTSFPPVGAAAVELLP